MTFNHHHCDRYGRPNSVHSTWLERGATLRGQQRETAVTQAPPSCAGTPIIRSCCHSDNFSYHKIPMGIRVRVIYICMYIYICPASWVRRLRNFSNPCNFPNSGYFCQLRGNFANSVVILPTPVVILPTPVVILPSPVVILQSPC